MFQTLLIAALGSPALAGGPGTEVYVALRDSSALAVYDFADRELAPEQISGLGDLRHAIMAFSQDLRWGYVATRSGLLSRVDLARKVVDASVQTSENSIDIAISQDGRSIAVAEYEPGGLTILDAETLEITRRLPADNSRVTGVVDAPGGRFVCVQMEAAEIWIVGPDGPTRDGSRGDGWVIEHRIPTPRDLPYDAMITPDGRYYLVGHIGSEFVSVVDLTHPEEGAGTISLVDPDATFEREVPVKLPHMASWAVAGGGVYVPLVGEKRLVVLEPGTWEYQGSIPVRGHPVYAVRSPTDQEIWVSFSGEGDDAWIDVIDTQRREVIRSIEVGRRIYHMDFTPRGAYALVSANGDDALALIDATTYAVVDRQTLPSPSGIFGLWRAYRIGL